MPGIGRKGTDSFFEKNLAVDQVFNCTGMPFACAVVSTITGGNVQLQVSADGVNFANYGSATSATGYVAVPMAVHSFKFVNVSGGPATFAAQAYATRS